MSISDNGDALKKLHARIVDSTNGYAEGIEKAEERDVVAFFEGFKSLHERHASELDTLLLSKGFEPQEDGSWMTWVHEGIMKMRSAFGTLDESVMDEVIQGEQAILDIYDEALTPEASDEEARALLSRQKLELQARVADSKSALKAA